MSSVIHVLSDREFSLCRNKNFLFVLCSEGNIYLFEIEFNGYRLKK